MKCLRTNKFFIVYFCLLVIAVTTTIFCAFRIEHNELEKDYISFSEDWISGTNQADLSEIYKYREVHKTLPKFTKDTQIYFQVQNINIDVYIDNQCLYQSSNINQRIYGKTKGDYFIPIYIDKNNSGKTLSLRISDPYKDNSGKVLNAYLGNSNTIIADFISNHTADIIISIIMIGLGMILIISYIPLKSKKIVNVSALYLGIFSFIVGVFILSDSHVLSILYGHDGLFYLISQFAKLLIIVPLMLFIKNVLDKIVKQSHIDLICISAILCFCLSFLLNLLGIFDFHQSIFIIHFIYFISIFYIIYISVKALIEKDKENRIHAIGFLCIAIGCILDLLLIYFSSQIKNNYFIKIGVLAFLGIEELEFIIKYFKMNNDHEKIDSLNELAYYDGLTELLNRTSFQEDMKKLKNSTNGLIAIFDINDLKYVNDHFGHSSGDQLITTVAKILKNTVGECGKCYRIGGDELVFISEQENIKEEFLIAYDKMTADILKYNKTHSKKYDISVAMGYSEITKGIKIDKAFKIADTSMYENKKKMKKKSRKRK